jgi:shikimate dehydrogenase
MKARSFLIGLLGGGVAASRSPEIHETEARALGLTLVYRTIDSEAGEFGAAEIPDALRWAERAGFDGLNVTHPFKQQVIPFLDGLSDEAASLEAVNTVTLSGGRRIGHNTDWSGFADNFRHGLPEARRDHVLQIGAGGAGAAVGYAILKLGAKHLTILDREMTRSTALAGRLAKLFPGRAVDISDDIAASIAVCDGVIQASPVGMASHPGTPFPPELILPSQWVAEIIYFPLETDLLRIARARGLATLDGSGMVVRQAARAFELFTGVTPDTARMLDAFKAMTAP